MKRRTLLIGSAAATAGGLALGYVGMAAMGRGRGLPASAAAPGEAILAGWVKIGEDDSVTVYLPHADMGQGVGTALAMMLAEELDADWPRVRTEPAPGDARFANRFLARGWVLQNRQIPALFDGVIDTTFGTIAGFIKLQITGGSTAVRFTGQSGMRITGALARMMLVEAAAQRWGVPAGELSTAASRVLHAASGRSLRYGELAAEAARLPLPSQPRFKQPGDYRLVGTSVPRLDIPAKVDGSAQYGIDVRLPEMRYAAVLATPRHGGRLVAVDPAPALAMAGVERVVSLPDAVAVIATRYTTARRALAALRPRFEGGDESLSSERLFAGQRAALEGEGKSRVAIGNVVQASVDGRRRVDAHYQVPFLHHAAMEPMNATAQQAEGRFSYWGGTQNLLWARSELAKLAGLPLERVTMHPMPLGGSFGRHGLPEMSNHIPQIARLAAEASPHPVKMIWSREEDFAQGAYRPALSSRVQAVLDADGRPLSWEQRYIDTAGRNEAFEIPYAIANQSIEAVDHPHPIRTGAWRSVSHTQHGFYTETFIDELAHAARQDPVEYRRALLPAGSRLARVLDEAARRSGWRSATPAGRARGIALVESFGTAVAHVLELSLSDEGVPRVHRITSAVDCGRVIHPDTARQQVEGAILMGLSAALGEQITVQGGAVQQRNFTDYPILRMAQVPPELDIHFLASEGPLGGLGEPGVPPVAPALGNALFALTGLRIRALPVLPQLAASASARRLAKATTS
ncbi:molybdopterin-dependent oxidoreductase [Variovorax sp. LjRoot290]|uniref:xanthine dehydrogenase family protein molybdopterin-binding subunit n=1 Tax=unclassified Variovorax TaxID=663243 RepID=UPI003ED1272A